jgi:hypothetical protein
LKWAALVSYAMRTTTKRAPVKEIEQKEIEQKEIEQKQIEQKEIKQKEIEQKQIPERIDRTNELFEQRCPRIPIGSGDLFGVHTLEYGYLPNSHLPAPTQ